MADSTRATPTEAQTALASWGRSGVSPRPHSGGLINSTFLVDHGGEQLVLQRVHPIFPEAIHENIRAVTEHLAFKGFQTPRLLATKAGDWCSRVEGHVWRLMTRVPGETQSRLDAGSAGEAGRMLGSFHNALLDLNHEFVGLRAGVHDTSLHLARLRIAVQNGTGHRLFHHIEPLANALLRAAEALPSIDAGVKRVVHGDPKFQNLLFKRSEPQRAVCWVDLDTVGPALLATELGDAWRSWCNLSGEDEAQSAFSLSIYEASLEGYTSATGGLTQLEQTSLLHGVEWITLELASRFACDALAESYFGWDSIRFSSAGEHNLVRARGQWSLHEQVISNRTQRAQLLAKRQRSASP